MNKKRVAINMTAQLMAFAVSMILGFVLVLGANLVVRKVDKDSALF